MKLAFNTKIKDDDLKNAIIKNFPAANIVHISRSGEIGTVEISGLEEVLKNNLCNIINSLAASIPDVEIKATVKKIFTKEDVKNMQVKKVMPATTIEEEDDKDIPAMDFTGLLNAQINAHVKKAKKSISLLQDKFNSMIEEYNVNSGGFAEKLGNIQGDIKKMQDTLALTIEENSKELDAMQKIFTEANEKTLQRIVAIENRFEKLDSCIENMIKIFAGIEN